MSKAAERDTDVAKVRGNEVVITDLDESLCCAVMCSKTGLNGFIELMV